MEGESEIVQITSDEEGERLDKILAARFAPLYSRSYFQNLIASERILLNGSPAKKRFRIVAGDEVEIAFLITPDTHLAAEEIPLDILFEDEELLLINKPTGMVVHPAPGNPSGTVVNALLAHCRDLQGIDSDNIRPGIVHRLDKETSGILLLAKNPSMQQQLMRLFAERRVEKEYRAITIGNPGNQTVALPIGRHPIDRKKMSVQEERGRDALTRIETLAYNRSLAHVALFPRTGRTHQLRVHLQALRFPILGDPIYGNLSLNKKWNVDRLLLHAFALSFPHPRTGETLRCEAPLPEAMTRLIAKEF